MATCHEGCAVTKTEKDVDLSSQKIACIDLTVKQEAEPGAIPFIDLTLEPLLAGIGPGKKAFIDLTIESLRDDIAEVVIDLTEDEDVPKAILDLNTKLYGPDVEWRTLKTKSRQWYVMRKSTLGKLADSFYYTDASLEPCWHAVCRSPRFNNGVVRDDPYFRLPVANGTWLKNLIDVPEDDTITVDMNNLPFRPGRLLRVLSTLQSFTMRIHRLIDYGSTCEDRQRAAFDTLCFPVFPEIVNSLLRYTQDGTFRIPQQLFPDRELLQLSRATLHRAMQFYQYMIFKQIHQLNFYKMLSAEMRNVDSMMKVVNILCAVLEKSERRKKRKRKSDGNNNVTNLRANNNNVASQRTGNINGPARKTRWDDPGPNRRETNDNGNVPTRSQQANNNDDTDDQALVDCKLEEREDDKDAIKTELKEEFNFDIAEPKEEPNTEITVQMNTDATTQDQGKAGSKTAVRDTWSSRNICRA